MKDETVELVPIRSFAKKLEAGQAQAQRQSKGRWNLRARDCLQKVCVIYLILKNPRSPFRAKAVAALSVGYIFSPIQLIPSFIPVIGWLDDRVGGNAPADQAHPTRGHRGMRREREHPGCKATSGRSG
jgi:hypothetical protein